MASTLSDEDYFKVTTLNSEGNALFKEMNYVAAAAKYTATIEISGQNAISYSNRAACWLSLHLYIDALCDATKATKLDPSFVKAYARRARALDALGQPSQSIRYWGKALNALPRGDLASSEETQQYEYRRELAAARREQTRQRKALEMSVKQHLILNGEGKGLPWMMAKGLLPTLVARGDYTSCAWTLNRAYDVLCEGMQELYSTVNRPESDATPSRVLEHISNSVLIDYRAWHIRKPDYLEEFHRKAVKEIQFYHAFIPNHGLEAIKRKVLGSLARTNGEANQRREWDIIRPSLTTTVRYWVMEGFHQGTLYRNPAAGTNYLGQAIALIKWGQTHWRRIPKEIKGEVFEETYLKRVQFLRLRFLLEQFDDADLPTRQAMYQEADGIVNETTGFQPSRERDTVLTAYSWYSARGYALNLKARQYQANGLYAFAGLSYKLSAECFAEDDGNYIANLLSYVKSAEYIQSPSIEIQQEALKKIRKVIPKLNYIWKAKKEVNDIDKTIKEALIWGETFKARLRTDYYDQFY